MSLKNWEINGLSLPLDLEDLEMMEHYESVFQKMKEEEQEIPKIGKATERIRAYCNLYLHLFENLFGEDAAQKIFEGVPLNSGEYEKVYFNFLDFVRKQRMETAKIRAEKLLEFAPKNRHQRRKSQKRRRK